MGKNIGLPQSIMWNEQQQGRDREETEAEEAACTRALDKRVGGPFTLQTDKSS